MTMAARGEAPEAGTAVPPATKAGSRRLVPIVLLALSALGAGGYYVSRLGVESTDDAQVDGEVVAVPARVAGTVVAVHFVENQRVKAGDLLVELDAAPARAKLAQAEAGLAAALAASDAANADAEIAETNAVGNKSVAEAGFQTASVGAHSYSDQIREGEAQVKLAETNLAQATTDHDRARSLFAKGAIAQAEMDRSETAFQVAQSNVEAAKARLASVHESATQAKSRVVEASARVKQTSNVDALVREARARADAAKAQVETARAARDLAALDLSYTKIFAPQDGVVSKKVVSVGQALAIGQAVGQLVTPNRWVQANFKETQVGKMRPGQPARFTVDAYPGTDIPGSVESLSGGTGARFTLLPPDNASGNFTKVVQRVPVRIQVKDVPAGVELRPGMSVELTVDTRK